MTRTKRITQIRRPPTKLLMLVGLAVGTFLLIWAVNQFSQSTAYRSLEEITFWLGETYERWFNQQSVNNPFILLGLSFAGGLVASISPCILSLLPVNLSYIGTREITSRKDACFKAGAFVLGVVTVLSLLGLFSSLAAIVLVKFRGYFHAVIGSLILLMGLSLAGVIQLPRLQNRFQISQSNQQKDASGSRSPLKQAQSILTGPYGVGLTFALVSSPCTSPVMFAVLAAAAATGSQLQSTLAMISYALGYTAIIFFASLFTGLAKQTRSLLTHSETIIRIASLVLLLVGGFYLINGIRWIVLTL